jgi:hypothetical protein
MASSFQGGRCFLFYPIDLDFSMLLAFPDAYQVANPGGRGPQSDANAIQAKRSAHLKQAVPQPCIPSSMMMLLNGIRICS